MPFSAATIKRYLGWISRISREEPEEQTRQEILNDVSLKGANLWLLVFTMIIACIGLNMNSAYAVIGAMLMSPLMAPVIGMGFATATNNWSMLKYCTWNWVLSLTISLVASAVYFKLTPFQGPSDTMIGFSKATIYDILLALFGGMAGFIGITRLSGMKVLAGVAVATACMPPLSTAGYGLANGQWNFFWGGSYFYIINCIYIGFAVMLLAKLMHFQKAEVTGKKPLTARVIYVLAVISLVPASYFAWQLAQEKKVKDNIERFVSEILQPHHVTILKTDVNLKSKPQTVDIYVTGQLLSTEERNSVMKSLAHYELSGTKLTIHTSPEFDNLKSNPALLEQITIQQELRLKKQDSLIKQLTGRMDSIQKAIKR